MFICGYYYHQSIRLPTWLVYQYDQLYQFCLNTHISFSIECKYQVLAWSLFYILPTTETPSEVTIINNYKQIQININKYNL